MLVAAPVAAMPPKTSRLPINFVMQDRPISRSSAGRLGQLSTPDWKELQKKLWAVSRKTPCPPHGGDFNMAPAGISTEIEREMTLMGCSSRTVLPRQLRFAIAVN